MEYKITILHLKVYITNISYKKIESYNRLAKVSL